MLLTLLWFSSAKQNSCDAIFELRSLGLLIGVGEAWTYKYLNKHDILVQSPQTIFLINLNWFLFLSVTRYYISSSVTQLLLGTEHIPVWVHELCTELCMFIRWNVQYTRSTGRIFKFHTCLHVNTAFQEMHADLLWIFMALMFLVWTAIFYDSSQNTTIL